MLTGPVYGGGGVYTGGAYHAFAYGLFGGLRAFEHALKVVRRRQGRGHLEGHVERLAQVERGAPLPGLEVLAVEYQPLDTHLAPSHTRLGV